jgi:hypothetical protein
MFQLLGPDNIKLVQTQDQAETFDHPKAIDFLLWMNALIPSTYAGIPWKWKPLKVNLRLSWQD